MIPRCNSNEYVCSWTGVANYIDRQYEDYLHHELSRSDSLGAKDPRIHACIYVFPAHQVVPRPADLALLKAISGMVPILVVVSKSDSLKTSELDVLKARLLHSFARFSIHIGLSSIKDKRNAIFTIMSRSAESECRVFPWGSIKRIFGYRVFIF
jgi:septin family protein